MVEKRNEQGAPHPRAVRHLLFDRAHIARPRGSRSMSTIKNIDFDNSQEVGDMCSVHLFVAPFLLTALRRGILETNK